MDGVGSMIIGGAISPSLQRPRTRPTGLREHHVTQAEPMVLYHGTSEASARELMQYGWAPERGRSGGQCGQARYLYLTTTADNAQWYATEKMVGVVLKVEVDRSQLRVDPEDGVGGTIEEEMNCPNGFPGNLVCVSALSPESFSFHATADPTPEMT